MVSSRTHIGTRLATRLLFSFGAAITLSGLLAVSPASSPAYAQDYASKQRRAAALGYYSRARTLMVEALAEFEQGRRYAQPDLLLDTEEWRLTMITLTEQLNRLIDPKPRVTIDGVRFRANPRLIRRERDRLPPVPDGAQDSNVYGEQQRLRELEAARARMYGEEQPYEAVSEPEPVAPPMPAAERQEAVEQAVEQAIESAARPAEPQEPGALPEQPQVESVEPGEGYVQEEAANDQEELTEEEAQQLGLSPEGGPTADSPFEGTEAQELSEEGKDLSEDEKVAAAIEQAIRERLNSLEVSEEENVLQ